MNSWQVMQTSYINKPFGIWVPAGEMDQNRLNKKKAQSHTFSFLSED